MTHVPHPVGAGHFARQQIYSRDPLIAWSHRRRFRTALALARPFAGGRVLDYGCGDGTFLGLLQASGTPPALAVGAEIDPRIVTDCQRRFASVPGVRFEDVTALDRDDEAGSYDAIFCMEVLEHVDDPLPLLAQFERLLKPRGTLVISVPIETGLPLLVKQLVRRVAGWRGIGNYPGTSSYTLRELVTSVFAGVDATHRSSGVPSRRRNRVSRSQRVQLARAASARGGEIRSCKNADLTLQLDGPAPGYPGAGSWHVDVPPATEPLNSPRVAVVADLREERWHSMDLVAEMSLLNVEKSDGAVRRDNRGAAHHGATFHAIAAHRRNSDRGYRGSDSQPRLGLPAVASLPGASEFDLFHIMDHSYAHLALHLPAGRSLITCHDLDAFRGVLPGSHGGSIVQRALGRRLIAG